VLLLLLVSALAAIAFVEIEARTRNPLLNLRLFANPTFAAASLVGFVFGAGMFGSFYLMPIFVRTVQGFTGTKTGVLLLLADVVSFAVFPVAGWLAQRINPAWPVTAGMLLFGASSLALTTIDADSSFTMLAGWSALGRIGLGLAIPALTIAALHALDRDLIAYGAGTMNFIRMMGGAMGVNALAIILEQRAAHHADTLAATQTVEGGATSELLAGVVDMLARGGVPAADRLPMAMIYLGDIIEARANSLAYQDGYMALVIAFSVATLCALTLAWKPAGKWPPRPIT
jgi:predicted MFS family arabinose efflux permease